MSKITFPRLQFITQPRADLEEIVRAVLSQGIRWVQLREKNLEDGLYLERAKRIASICRDFSAYFIVNDNIHVAKESRAHGVHLGQTDESVQVAREILGPTAIIGGTANTKEQVQKLVQSKVDYIGLGPYRFTTTKEKLSPVLGLEGIRSILASEVAKEIPVFAIGNILAEDVSSLRQAGVYGVAVSSALMDVKEVKGDTSWNLLL